MLREDIVAAIAEGKFHIYPVKTIDQGMEVLTGLEAGELQEDGTYLEDTINYMVNKRLRELADKLKEYRVQEKEERETEGEESEPEIETEEEEESEE